MINLNYVFLVVGLFFIVTLIILWDHLSGRKSNKSTPRHRHATFICPRCKSTDVKYNWQLSVIGRSIFDVRTCNNCGYTSRLFPELC